MRQSNPNFGNRGHFLKSFLVGFLCYTVHCYVVCQYSLSMNFRPLGVLSFDNPLICHAHNNYLVFRNTYVKCYNYLSFERISSEKNSVHESRTEQDGKEVNY